MRIPDALVFDRAARSTMNARDRLDRATNTAASGLRVEHPWDDPAAAGAIARNRIAAARQATLSTTAIRARDEVRSADGALGQLGNLVTRAQELAVQMSNSTYDAGHRAGAAAEVRGLFDQAVALLNTKVGNRYVFGGTADAAPPFDPAGNYAGDSGVRRVEIAPGVVQDASVRADVYLKGTAGGVDVLATLQALADALAANDVTGVQGSLPGLGAGLNQVSAARAEAGVIDDVFTTASSIAELARDDARSAVATDAEADVVRSASDLALAQFALQAALTASAQSFKLTLLDKLG